ncbi:Tetratricopeptide repeat-like superfamily protein isoform 2 [Hibiscus syriacus]|uniref:Tetratricopeptide repeat-like superfamily protein isoform 2 n=1 Tax=Hibiscus syriacus TaxID=106335 RepID=A0A6A3CNS3_HIBSY|nr:Tetratricopeptide repeat-like superfamily protein isoform 2 [Hibiscus syriacus]
MVAGKVRLAMGLQKSTSNPRHETSSKPPGNKTTSTSQKAGFSLSFGVYFPRSSAQVQPRPPDVTELLRLVEELRERESRLKTELLEHKLLKESAAEVERLRKGNEVLRTEVELTKGKIEEGRGEREKKVMEMEEVIAELKKTVSSLSDRNSKVEQFQGTVEVGAKSTLIKNLKRNNHIGKCTNAVVFSCLNNDKAVSMEFNREELESERRGHSASISDELVELTSVYIRSRLPRVSKPPPKPSSSSSSSPSTSSNDSTEKQTSPPPPPTPPPPAQVVAVKEIAPPPPPPPPIKVIAPPPPPQPRKGMRAIFTKRRRWLYRPEATPASAISRDMIGEIENRSAYLLAIKKDVETQGDFVRFLIKEVENAAFTDIEDAVPFVKWLDDELSYLVDERAVLKHFAWPEQKADALREAAFGYCDIKKLESEASSFHDDPRQPCARALKKLQTLHEKLEHAVYKLSRMRESAANKFKGFHIPMDWMLETGIVCQMKLASVKLAMKYMRRVSAELEAVVGVPEEKDLIVQGARFAFRVHQFAGGFDKETMKAFKELRDKARSCHVQYQNQ